MTVLEEKIYEYLANDEYEQAIQWLIETEGLDEAQAIGYVDALIDTGRKSPLNFPLVSEETPIESEPQKAIPSTKPPFKMSAMSGFLLGVGLTAIVFVILFLLLLSFIFSLFIDFLNQL